MLRVPRREVIGVKRVNKGNNSVYLENERCERGEKLMIKPWKSNRGQSIVEYLIVATLIVTAILAFRVTLKTKTTALLTEAVNVIDKASTQNDAGFGLETIKAGAN